MKKNIQLQFGITVKNKSIDIHVSNEGFYIYYDNLGDVSKKSRVLKSVIYEQPKFFICDKCGMQISIEGTPKEVTCETCGQEYGRYP